MKSPLRDRRYSVVYLTLACLLLCRSARGLGFTFTETPALQSLALTAPDTYATLQAGITRGAAMWSSVIENDTDIRITVDVDPNLSSLAAAGPNGGLVPYAALQERLPSLLPSNVPSFAVGASQQVVDASRVYVTSAEMKATGVFDSPLRAGQSDGLIILSLANKWDSDPSDGINGFDLSAVTAHELMHVLGALSSADAVFPNRPELAGQIINPTLWDMSRFAAEGVRSLAPGVPVYLSLDNGRTGQDRPLTLGTSSGQAQAGHFNLPPSSVDLSFGFVANVSTDLQPADLAAAEAAGWTVRKPGASAGAGEPSAGVLVVFMVLALCFLALWRVRRQSAG